MRLGIIGLGKMGANMSRRLLRDDHEVVGYDLDASAVRELAGEGVEAADSVEDLVGRLTAPRICWMMVPAGEAVDQTIDAIGPLLEPGDAIVDGGNSNYRDTLERADRVAEHGLDLVDVGTSGGVWGLEEGYSMMVGGPAKTVARMRPLFETLAPGPEEGWGRVGPTGSGHFVKMIHNGIEYGMMQAYAEGFAIMEAKDRFDLDLHRVAEIWRSGSVIRSWLLDLSARALKEDTDLSGIAPYVEDSGEGRWTVQEAIDLDVPAPVITDALIQRLASRTDDSYAHRMLAALRQQFGGHAVREAGED